MHDYFSYSKHFVGLCGCAYTYPGGWNDVSVAVSGCVYILSFRMECARLWFLSSRKEDGVVLPLHGGGGEVGLSRFFYSNKRFDSAMMAYLECVKEVTQPNCS